MRKVFTTIICLFSLLFCACEVNKQVDDMNLIELNINYTNIQYEYNSLRLEVDKLLDIVGNKTSNEVIEMINELNNEVIKSNVMITNESKTYFNGTSISSGSGTIIKEDESRYYVLTNNHVIYSLNANRTSYYVYDYLNNEYRANVEFYDANYDLALLSFEKNSTDLRVMNLANSDPSVKNNIITIGQPLGQRNIITFGEVIKYDYVNCDNCNTNETNIDYECMYYDAVTTNGNSGGMIINFDYELVGVVTYGVTVNGMYAYGAGSSVVKVREFLTNNLFEVGDLYE